MPTLTEIVDRELRQQGATRALLRSRRKADQPAKQALMARIIRQEVAAGKGLRETVRDVRSLGFTVRNETIREAYREAAATKISKGYYKKTRFESLPNPNRYPVLAIGDAAKANFLYTATVYLKCDKAARLKDKTKRRRAGIQWLGAVRKFNATAEFGFWSDKLMTRGEVRRALQDRFLGLETAASKRLGVETLLGGKRGVRNCQVVGFRDTGPARKETLNRDLF